VLERMLWLFVLAQVVHIARWRWGAPSGYLFWFLRVWLILPVLGIVIWLGGRALYLHSVDQEEAVGWLGVIVGYGALCGAYVMIYPAISDLSPSLEILRELDDAPGRTLPVDEIKIVAVAGVDSVSHRLENLQSSGLLIASNDVLTVTAKGRLIAAVLTAYRGILGIKQGAGG